MIRLFGWIKQHKKIVTFIMLIFIVGSVVLRPKSTPLLATQTVTRQDFVQSLSETGSITSKQMINLNFLTGAKLAYVGAQVGDTVSKGQTIAMEDEQSAEKNLQIALRDYSLQRNTFDQNGENYGMLNPNNATNDTLKRILQDNQYNLDKAVFSVELQSIAQQQSVLISPISGVLVRADVTVPGVNVSATTTYSVADMQQLLFRADVDEADIGRVQVGQMMQVTLDAFPDRTFDVPITRIDFASHTTSTGGTAYTVEANMQTHPSVQYRIGMNGDAEIILATHTNVLTVPINSLVDNQYVYVLTGNHYIKKRVVPGLTNDTDVEIQSGLQEGDKVVLQPSSVKQ